MSKRGEYGVEAAAPGLARPSGGGPGNLPLVHWRGRSVRVFVAVSLVVVVIAVLLQWRASAARLPTSETPLERSSIGIAVVKKGEPRPDWGVHFLAVSPNGNLYAGHVDGAPLRRYSNVVHPIEVGPGSGGVAVGPDGTVYATDGADQVLVVIEEERITARVDLRPALPTDLAVAPDGTVYVVADNNLLVVRDNQLVKTIDLGSTVYFVAVASDGTVYATVYGQLVVIQDLVVTDRVAVAGAAGQIGVTSAGTVYLATAYPECSVTVVEGRTVSATIRVGDYECTRAHLAVAPDDTVYVSGGFLSESDSVGLAVIRGTELSTIWVDLPETLSIAVGPDGAIYLATREEEVLVLR